MKGIIVQGNSNLFNFYRLRFEIFKRDNFTCQYCGRNVKEDGVKLHCDHILPNKKGGLFVADNLITACEECNLGKRDVLLHERKISRLIQRERKIELSEIEVVSQGELNSNDSDDSKLFSEEKDEGDKND